MRKINYSVIFFLMLLFIACDDKLDRFPLDSFAPENYFNNESELQTFSNQFYWLVPSAVAGYGENSDVILNHTMTPEMQGTRIVPNSGGGWDWGSLRNINLLLKYSYRCEDVDVREHYEGIARFFRAWFYFEKVKRFGDVPWYDKVLGSTDPELMKPRDSREFVMTKILEDLEFAIKKIPATKSTERITHWTALALKSRICLFEGTFRKYHQLGDWEKYLTQCVDASEKLMSSNQYRIYQNGAYPYRDLFASVSAIEDEVILARRYSKELKVYHDANFHLRGLTGGRAGMSKKIVDSYLMKDGSRFTEQEGWKTMQYYEEMQNRDPRLTQTVVNPGHIRVADKTKTVLAPDFNASISGYQIQKWDAGPDGDGWQQSYNDFIVFRIAEIYLNYAEAKAELGTLIQEDLNISIKKIRDRVGMPNIDMNQANSNPDPYLESPVTGYRNVTGPNKGVILEIRRERTIELACEGHRYYDIIRWKEGKVFEQEFYGMYFNSLDKGTGENRYGLYDMNDGQIGYEDEDYVDICIYSGKQPSDNEISETTIILFFYKLNELFRLENGVDGGRIICHDLKDNPRKWDEEKDYLYPIPVQERLLNHNLTQNPGWNDGLSF
ncbi:RagB/SusD family nutrient uptake outer membrane protein [Coprobacter secundus]|uniref:RagB/SusD family nutrient uptake outer membrane protein n=1 Tax=Coprobacter secundus subsp. similis TaxID=2751153 RepID=A0A7G1HW52_9BACT|nr:RagB/SusD family nutrient uptake outer membrane protein [Coprobacter secundus]BCI63263.1 hypothetical protein Cop2CBH44_16160 [Coprobacter secundus subsp. similis]CCY38649.1 uncharacterized protein BN472_02831 [Tannerella sp. CAG:118]